MRRGVALLALAACTLPPPTGLGPEVTSHVTYKVVPLSSKRMLDVLFVIDSSPAMRGHAANVRANARDFINVLQTIPGGLPDIHVGVVTTDLGTDGAPATAGCRERGEDGVLRAIDGVRFLADEIRPSDGVPVRNYAGELADVFARLVDDVGTDGCAIPRPLEAARRALAHPANAGFLRDDAYLAVIFISASDDCSFASPEAFAHPNAATCFTHTSELVPITEYAAALRALKQDPDNVIVAGIIGGWETPELVVGPDGIHVAPSCFYRGASATPARRLHQLIDSFPGRGTHTTICQANLSDGVYLFSELPTRGFADPCVSGTLHDTDLETPGLQPECAVSIVTPDDEWLVPPCPSGDRTAIASDAGLCWRLVEDPECLEGDSTKLVLNRRYFPRGSRMIAQCVTE